MKLFNCCKKHKVQDVHAPEHVNATANAPDTVTAADPATAHSPARSTASIAVREILANRRNEICLDDDILYRNKKLYSNKIFAAMRIAKENGRLTVSQMHEIKDCFENENVDELIRVNSLSIARVSI